jgi:hypothetical protein
MRGVARNDTRRNPNIVNRRRNFGSCDSIELDMASPVQINAEHGSVWQYKHVAGSKYRFLHQIGRTVYYEPLTDDSKEFTTDVDNWVEHYVQIDI